MVRAQYGQKCSEPDNKTGWNGQTNSCHDSVEWKGAAVVLQSATTGRALLHAHIQVGGDDPMISASFEP